MIYLIGSLRNPRVPKVAAILRSMGTVVFDEWYSPGPRADDYWKAYEQERGMTYVEALELSHAAHHIFEFDRRFLEASEACVLLLPAGRSAHLEFGWMRGRGKDGWIILDGADERWDVMYQFASGVFDDAESLVAAWRRTGWNAVDR